MLGKYQLIAEIARGGMGVVYLAMVQGPGGFNKLVVVKELKPELVEEPAFLTMFLDEARLAARLNHPNIVQTNEVGNDGDRYFMAMDYLDGRGLDQVRRRSKTAGFGLSVPMHLRVMCDMLSGLEYAHRLSDFDGSPLHIVHRDISPQNVFVTFDGQVKLLDFGIAKAADSMHQTHAGVVKGKVSYMSPEQGRGWKVDARADVFSAGVMLWEALTGKRMRDGKNDQEKLWALVSEDVPRASSIKPWVPAELDKICARAMAWNRDDRYPSAGAMQYDLERYLAASGSNVSAREVGTCVSELFHDDRASTNGVIEAHVARARGGTLRDTLPVIDVALRLSVGSPTPSEERRPAKPLADAETEQATSRDSPSARLAEASSSASDPHRRERLRRFKAILVASIAGVVAASAVILYVSRATLGSEPVAPPVPSAKPVAAPPAPAPPPAAPKPGYIDVQIQVSPATAMVSIDDADIELDGHPFHRRYLSDNSDHRVYASAPGYVAKSVTVVFNANVTLDLSLERIADAVPARPARATGPAHSSQPGHTVPAHAAEPDPPRSAPAARPPSEPPAKPPDVDPAGGNKPRRPIDPNNPYGGGP